MKTKGKDGRKGRPPSNDKRDYSVTARISEKHNIELKKITNTWGVAGALVLRKLIKKVISGKLVLLDLLEKRNTEEEDLLPSLVKYKCITAKLTQKETIDFSAISNSWDLSSGTLARLLIEHFLKMPDKNFLWV